MREDDSVFEDIETTSVKFLHGRPYADGYALDIIDPTEGVEGRIVVRWDVFPDHAGWVAHDLVELFMAYVLPQVAQRFNNDFVLYLDCLRMECGEPHLYSRKMLEANGRLADPEDSDDVWLEEIQ